MPRVVRKGVTLWPFFAFIGMEASVGSRVSGGMRGRQMEMFEQHLGQPRAVGHWAQFNLFSCARRKMSALGIRRCQVVT